MAEGLALWTQRSASWPKLWSWKPDDSSHLIFQELNRIPEPPESWTTPPPTSSAPFQKRTHSPCVSSVHDINHCTSDRQPVSKTPRGPSARKCGQPRLPKALISWANIGILSNTAHRALSRIMLPLKSVEGIYIHLAPFRQHLLVCGPVIFSRGRLKTTGLCILQKVWGSQAEFLVGQIISGVNWKSFV